MPDVFDKTFALFANPANAKIIFELESLGAKVFAFAPVGFEQFRLAESSSATAFQPSNYDWLVFSDTTAVDFFVQLLEENGTDLFELDALRICSFGEAVADQLRFSQLHTDVIPNKNDAAAVIDALKSYIGEDKLAELRFLIAKGSWEKIELTEKLRKARAKVWELTVYKINIIEQSQIARLKTLLAGGAIDEFIFTTQTDFIALKSFFDKDFIKEIFSETIVSAADPIILQTLKEYDFKNAILFRTPKLVKVNE